MWLWNTCMSNMTAYYISKFMSTQHVMLNSISTFVALWASPVRKRCDPPLLRTSNACTHANNAPKSAWIPRQRHDPAMLGTCVIGNFSVCLMQLSRVLCWELALLHVTHNSLYLIHGDNMLWSVLWWTLEVHQFVTPPYKILTGQRSLNFLP